MFHDLCMPWEVLEIGASIVDLGADITPKGLELNLGGIEMACNRASHNNNCQPRLVKDGLFSYWILHSSTCCQSMSSP